MIKFRLLKKVKLKDFIFIIVEGLESLAYYLKKKEIKSKRVYFEGTFHDGTSDSESDRRRLFSCFQNRRSSDLS